MRPLSTSFFTTTLLLSLSALTTSHPATSTSSSSSDPLPLIIWHGLGDNYAADGLNSVAELAQEVNPGTYTYMIRLDEDPSSDKSATFFGNVTEQVSKVCADLAAEPILSTAPAVNALGFSQGGQFLRAYIERCNKPPVRNLVTFGSQHNGISKYQMCGPTDWLCRGAMALLGSNTWSAFVQARLVPAQYFRAVDPDTGAPADDYLEYSNFLADVNNERPRKNETYARHLAALERFVMYVFEDDTVVIPKETSWFAEVNATSGEVTGLRNRTLYGEDWLGLRKLDEKGGLVFKTAPGNHMTLSDEVLVEAFSEYFAPSGEEDGMLVQQDEQNWEL